MNRRTRQRITGSISARVIVAGVIVALAGGLLDLVFEGGELFGTWSGILGLIGAYAVLMGLLVLGALEFLRATGY